jgi:rubrerythrin
MSINFSPGELINIAISIERSGITFYDIMAKSTDDPMTREIFQRLADMERSHIGIFEGMLDEAEKYRLDETATQEYADYLRALTDSAVFTDDMITGEMATQADNDIKALELAISAEKDSILFYYQMRDMMQPTALPLINRIIAEEKLHLRQLAEIKSRLTAAE